MIGAIKVNGKYGAMVGNLQVFTREGAVNAYKVFVRLFCEDVCMESSSVLSDVERDMQKLGFSPEELEELELSVYDEFELANS